jgi:hypothetical protein
MSEAETRQDRIRRQTNIRATNYYHRNKDKIKQQLSRKEACPICGKANLTKRQIPRHKKTQSCRERAEYIEKIKQETLEQAKQQQPTTIHDEDLKEEIRQEQEELKALKEELKC